MEGFTAKFAKDAKKNAVESDARPRPARLRRAINTPQPAQVPWRPWRPWRSIGRRRQASESTTKHTKHTKKKDEAAEVSVCTGFLVILVCLVVDFRPEQREARLKDSTTKTRKDTNGGRGEACEDRLRIAA